MVARPHGVDLVVNETSLTPWLERFIYATHKHPLRVKIALLATAILGAGLIGCGLFLGLHVAIAATCVVGGALLYLATCVAWYIYGLIHPFDMAKHAYQEGTEPGGSLTYRGHVPVLTLDADHPALAGEAQGFLCGSAINRLASRYEMALKLLFGWPSADKLKPLLATLKDKIPPAYWEEIQGMAKGYKRWTDAHPLATPISADQFLLMQLIPDCFHFHPTGFSKGLLQVGLGCTTVINKEDGKMNVARMLDFQGMGEAELSLVFYRHHKEGGELQSCAHYGLSALLGVASGDNGKIFLGMNVCNGETTEIQGLPAALYNLLCLEQCDSVKKVKEFVKNHLPQGPYQLYAVDANDAAVFHMDQTAPPGHPSLETLPWEGTSRCYLVEKFQEGHPLVVVNLTYEYDKAGIFTAFDMGRSVERLEAITDFFTHRKKDEPLTNLQEQYPINNGLSIHRIHATPGEFYVACDNARAGSTPLDPTPINLAQLNAGH